ncbi:MAG: hypothetical protein MJE68_33135 [Proteobacteria bacterium]|nr:hypothetical protein [Pseudomonadota bacterium]
MHISLGSASVFLCLGVELLRVWMFQDAVMIHGILDTLDSHTPNNSTLKHKKCQPHLPAC